MKERTIRMGWRALLASMAAVLLILPGRPGQADDALRLRINDAVGEPGGRVALVVRTYASRPIGEGEICFRASSKAGAGGGSIPFAELEEVRVFSKRRDALGLAELRAAGDGQELLLQFASASASINRVEGPMLALIIRLDEGLEPGQRFRLGAHLQESILFDSQGRVVPISLRGGELHIRRPAAPLKLAAEGDKVAPGELAELGVETAEPFAVAAGQVGFRYDPGVAAGPPTVRMDRRLSRRRRFSVDVSTPGLVLVAFRSRRSLINGVPGEIVSIRLPTSAGAQVGTRTRVWLDPSLTYLEDPEGDLYPLRLEKKSLRFE